MTAWIFAIVALVCALVSVMFAYVAWRQNHSRRQR